MHFDMIQLLKFICYLNRQFQDRTDESYYQINQIHAESTSDSFTYSWSISNGHVNNEQPSLNFTLIANLLLEEKIGTVYFILIGKL